MKHLSLVGMVVLCCSLSVFAASGIVTVESPAANSTVNSPVLVQATYNGTASYMKLWVDHVAVISQHSGSVLNYSATMSNGSHLVEVQAHDTTSNITYTTGVTITVVTKPAGISISPSSANVVQGQSQQFTASSATGTVTWSVSSSAGSISTSGLFTAGATTGPATITATDSGTATSATATATVVALAVTPGAASVAEGGTQTFTANVPVLWTASAGSITPSGSPATSAVFTAPATAGAVTITATETSATGTFTANATANVSAAPITVTPKQTPVVVGQQQQFTSSDPNVTWSITPSTAGTISNTGLFVAGTTTGPVTITATDSANSGNATATVIAFAITPNPASMVAGGTLTLTANAPATWAVTTSNGSITNTTVASTTATYTAPTTTGTATITATEAASSTITATDTVNIGALTVSPSAANTVEGQTQQFTANAAVGWTTSCGTIDSAGLFTAPNVVGTCTITATETGAGATATATDNVTAPANQGLNYVTWKNDNGRTGQQRNEKLLTPSNVNSTTFGVKFSVSIDGMAFAQPLYLSGITVNGAKHNVVFVATEHNSVYAFDSDTSGSPLWKKSFLINGATTVPQANVNSTIYPEIGITGTPVINPGTGILYVVAETIEGGSYTHRLHALDVTTGNEQFGGPKVIAPSGFASKEQLQRPALALANGNVYVSFGSQGDTVHWNGWVMAYSESTLSQVAAWNVSPGGSAGGIWGGGGGLSADSNGDIYVSTGNGNFNKTNQLSMSVVKLSPSLSVLDWFAPWDAVKQSGSDKDVASGGVLVVPDQSGSFPHELIDCGKLPQVHVLDRDNLGHQGATSNGQIVQELTNVVGGTSGRQANDHCFITPAYWEQNLYFAGNNDVIKQFTLNASTGKMSSAPTSKGSFTFIFPGAQPVTSSNGSGNGIVWAVDGASPAKLHAFDATNVSNTLYTSGSLVFEKWAVPTVVDGKVFVAGQGKMFVFGLF